MNDPTKQLAVSVIVPVYNSKELLREAVDSVLKQDFPSFELILVDDGSKDGSGELCDTIAREDSRVVVIHKENGGICSARNAALAVARGEYIAFCDNDDIYLPGLLADNYALAVEHKADIVRFSRTRVILKNGKEIASDRTGTRVRGITVVRDIGMHYDALRSTGNGVWVGLYSKAFLDEAGILFDENARLGMEDELFNLACYLHAKTIVLNPKEYYCWMQRVGRSTSVKYSDNVLESVTKCILLEEQLVKQTGAQEKDHGAWQFYLTSGQIAEMYYRMRRSGKTLTARQKKEILTSFRFDSGIDFSMDKEDEVYLKNRSLPVYIARKLFNKGHVWIVYILFLLMRR